MNNYDDLKWTIPAIHRARLIDNSQNDMQTEWVRYLLWQHKLPF